MRELLAELLAALTGGRDCVFCSVVETRGSTPQKAGAAMLVFPDGSQCGTLGGGCVEAEVRQRALGGMSQGRPEVHTFCLDENYGWDDGLICGGRMRILAHPLRAHDDVAAWEREQNRPEAAALGTAHAAASATAYYGCFRDLVEQGRGCTEAIVIADDAAIAPVGSRYLFDADNRLVAQLAAGPVPEPITRQLEPVQKRPKPASRHGIAYLPIPPRVTLLIVGGGHVGQAVAQLAGQVDFDIWVLDDRERYANRDRFPMAKRLLVGSIGATLKDLARSEITSSTFCIIVTRGHAHDEEALYHLAKTGAGYVGMIGSKRKRKLIYEDLIAEGVSPETLAKVHSPLGFDIGSQTVPEIAVSIVAELIACRNLGAHSAVDSVRGKRK